MAHPAESGKRHAAMVCRAARIGNETLVKFAALEGNGAETPARASVLVL